MNLSLQLKSFVNSAQSGLYTEITVPAERKEGDVTLKLHYMEQGSGEPLILVHSAGQSLYTWRSVINRLSDSYRVIAVELPGQGYSDKNPFCGYSIIDQANALRLFMYAVNIASAHFMAFSMGCLYVAEFARSHPERVGRIAMLSPGGLTAQMPAYIRMLGSQLFSIFASLTITPRRVESALLECFLDLTTVTPDIVNEYFLALAPSDARRALRSLVRSFDEEETLNSLREIAAPTLVIWGADDKWHTMDDIKRYCTSLQGCELSVIRNAGHLLHEEKPEKVAAAVLEFIPVPQPEEEETEAEDAENADSEAKTEENSEQATA